MGIQKQVIDTAQLNPNLNAIREHFDRHLARFFDQAEQPDARYFEDVVCYNCGSSRIASEFVVARFRHVRCAKCAMVYVSPRLREDVLHGFYDENVYTEHYRLKLVPALSYRRGIIDQRKFEQIAQYFERPGKVLDVGCGLGDLLSVFQEHDWSCLGIEFNSFAADFARKTFGLEVVGKSISDFESTDEQFDCIMMWGVLEHLTQPQVVLVKLHQLLRPGGILVLEVPSADSVLVRYFEVNGGYVDRIIEGDRHIMLFSVAALRQMTTRAGFRLVHLQANGLDIDTLMRLNQVECPKEVVADIQEAVDRCMSGDLLRGFWTRD